MELSQEQRDSVLKKFDAYLAERAEGNTLRESNKRKLKHWAFNNNETKQFRERMAKRYGIDPLSDDAAEQEKFPVLRESFSWAKMREQLEEKLQEADSESAFQQFLVAGLLQNVNSMYQLAKVSYQDWVHVVPTNLVETPIAPLHGLTFPREVGAQTPYPEVAAAALNLKIRVKRYGSIYSIEKDLLNDDMTGQFKQQAGTLGEYLQLLTEVLAYGKLASVSSMTYAGFDVPISETKPSNESNYPWTNSSAKFVGGGFNKPTSYGALTQGNIQTGIENQMLQKNLLGIIMSVNPNRLLISPYYRFDAAVLMNSSYYPSGAAAAGSVGGAFAVNPIQGLLDVTITRFMPNNSGVIGGLSKAWYLVDDSKPWMQMLVKQPVLVEQENPQSGESFNRNIYRFKCDTRMNIDIIDPRFAWMGSDGSV